MKHILCYGDSNTWGADPDKGGRYPWEVRWTGRLQTILGAGYRIIEEGCCGRTAVWDDPMDIYRNGRDYLYPCLRSHQPLDAVVLMLGSNELKTRFHACAYDIAKGAEQLVRIIQTEGCGPQGGSPAVLLVCPAPLGVRIDEMYFRESMGADALEKSKRLAPVYERTARTCGVSYLNAGIYTRTGADQLHFDAESHARFARAVAEKLAEMLD